MTCFSLSYPMADVDTFKFCPSERIPLTAACATVNVVISGPPCAWRTGGSLGQECVALVWIYTGLPTTCDQCDALRVASLHLPKVEKTLPRSPNRIMLLQTSYLQLLLPQRADPVNHGLRGRQRRDLRDLHVRDQLADAENQQYPYSRNMVQDLHIFMLY